METVDVLIAVFAVIAVVGSIGGAALYEPPAGGQTFDVAFSTEEVTLASQQVTDSASASTAADEAVLVTEHTVPEVGVAGLDFDVEVSTNRQGGALPRAANPTYEAYLVAPDGTELREGDATASGTLSGASVSFSLVVPAAYTLDVPEDTEIQAGSIDAARNQVNQTYLQSNATGMWQVHVHVSFPAGSAPVAETLTAEVVPVLQQVNARVGTDVDISPVA